MIFAKFRWEKICDSVTFAGSTFSLLPDALDRLAFRFGGFSDQTYLSIAVEIEDFIEWICDFRSGRGTLLPTGIKLLSEERAEPAVIVVFILAKRFYDILGPMDSERRSAEHRRFAFFMISARSHWFSLNAAAG